MHEADQVTLAMHALRGVFGTSMNPDDWELIDKGFSSLIIALGNTVFRVPRHREAADRQAACVRVLPELQSLLPSPIPVPIATVPANSMLPFGAVVFERLPGVPMRPDHAGPLLSEALGHLLAALHAIRPHYLSTPVRGYDDVDNERRVAMDTTLPFLRTVIPVSEYDHIMGWWASYRAFRAAVRTTPVLVHGDLWYGNVLVDPQHTRILGILDWEEMAFDDPAQDLATLRHSGDTFSSDVLAAYARAGGKVDDNLLARREWHWQCREIIGIAAAVKTGNAAEIEEALTKLLNGPVMLVMHQP